MAVISLKSEKLALTIIGFANLVQAIPSFAVVALVVPLLGIGFTPAIFAILLRALLPIVKNTYVGLSEVDNSIIDAAKGIGLTEWEIIGYVRFPHAYPAMFAGIKFAAVLANSIAILTAIIGSGGLGTLVFEGLASFNIEKVLAGSIPAIILAVLIDLSFSFMEKRLYKIPE
ncbi:binding-protein-dependent transport systems inner membrane component [Methanocaldococcus fervens AG86]|uniref:Binding-protein-dependent transport systems inner membrane component n=1 Tax=Methanocaldococcus fervens (strain DSM 4213 / JCM 15782 / AG86) TaxID=573064 RepID=C7P6J1_METFA|nr:ABC transporter permease [Methanocaldococcus fervens]ACV24173.1 binding-protein-dependent transport systems inner membrane component [Methanocaldococcus fervens AG86]